MDYLKLLDFTMQELGVEQTKEATIEDLVMSTNGNLDTFAGEL